MEHCGHAILRRSDAALDADTVQYADYVPLRDSAQIDGLVDADGVNVNLVLLRTYANANGDNVCVQDAMTGE